MKKDQETAVLKAEEEIKKRKDVEADAERIKKEAKAAQLQAEKEVKKHDLIAPMVGHVGDGNFHSIILFDPKDKDKQKKIKEYSLQKPVALSVEIQFI